MRYNFNATTAVSTRQVAFEYLPASAISARDGRPEGMFSVRHAANCSFTHRRRVAAYRLSRLNGSLAIASASKYVSKGSAGRSVYRGVDAHPCSLLSLQAAERRPRW